MSQITGIPTASPTGKERWTRSVGVERILCEMRALVLLATPNPRANLPEFYDWAKDLRRGRTNIMGGFFRLTDAVQRRGMGQSGRVLLLQLLDLAHQYVDLMLPESPLTPTSRAEPVHAPLRLYRPIRPANAVVVKRAA